jgi:hypothetical protein
VKVKEMALRGTGDLVVLVDVTDERRAVVTEGNGGNEFECILSDGVYGTNGESLNEIGDESSILSFEVDPDITSLKYFSTWKLDATSVGFSPSLFFKFVSIPCCTNTLIHCKLPYFMDR